jgi:hypothetical protein
MAAAPISGQGVLSMGIVAGGAFVTSSIARFVAVKVVESLLAPAR